MERMETTTSVDVEQSGQGAHPSPSLTVQDAEAIQRAPGCPVSCHGSGRTI